MPANKVKPAASTAKPQSVVNSMQMGVESFAKRSALAPLPARMDRAALPHVPAFADPMDAVARVVPAPIGRHVRLENVFAKTNAPSWVIPNAMEAQSLRNVSKILAGVCIGQRLGLATLAHSAKTILAASPSAPIGSVGRMAAVARVVPVVRAV